MLRVTGCFHYKVNTKTEDTISLKDNMDDNQVL